MIDSSHSFVSLMWFGFTAVPVLMQPNIIDSSHSFVSLMWLGFTAVPYAPIVARVAGVTPPVS